MCLEGAAFEGGNKNPFGGDHFGWISKGFIGGSAFTSNFGVFTKNSVYIVGVGDRMTHVGWFKENYKK